jgi:hypothetical protein
VRRDRDVGFVEAYLLDADGEVVATGTSTIRVIEID